MSEKKTVIYLNKYLELIINYSKFYINISHSMRQTFNATTHSTIVIALILKLKTNYNVHVLI